jgi:hypothetical protein
VSLFNLTGAAKFGLAVIVANILFVGSNVSLWILSIKNGQTTACSGIEETCGWIKGDITSQGIQALADRAHRVRAEFDTDPDFCGIWLARKQKLDERFRESSKTIVNSQAGSFI